MRKSLWYTLFIVVLAGSMIFGALGNSVAADKIKWKMTSTWSPAINLYYGEKELVKYVKEMTDGNFQIQYFPGGSLMGAFEVFDACSKGTVQAAGDWPSYWASKDPAFDFLGSFPFGFTNMDYIIWLYQFDGLELVQELFGKYGMTYFCLGATPMESGFRTTKKTGPINTMADYKGLKLRTPSRATIWILEQIGAAPVKIPGGEIYLAIGEGHARRRRIQQPGHRLGDGLRRDHQVLERALLVPALFRDGCDGQSRGLQCAAQGVPGHIQVRLPGRCSQGHGLLRGPTPPGPSRNSKIKVSR